MNRMLKALTLLIPLLTLQTEHGTTLGPGEEPQFSPDGSTIAFIKSSHIWTMNLRTEVASQLAPEGNMHYPNWSPDGTQIVFQSGGTAEVPNFSIYKISKDGTHLTRLTNADTGSRSDDQLPRWCRDGVHIVWTHGDQIWIMQSDGTYSRPLAPAAQGGYEYACDFSPDGKSLAYVRSDDMSEDHYRLRILSLANGSESIFLKDLTILGARWSNSGRILYCNTGAQLIKAEVHGSGAPKVVYNFRPAGLEFRYFDTSPDQKLVVYDDSGPERDGALILDTIDQSQTQN